MQYVAAGVLFFVFDFLPGCKYHMEYMKYLDAHCHIISDADISRARAAGVDGLVMNAARPDEWARVVDIMARHADVWGAIGVHPWYVGNLAAGWDAHMYDMLRQYPNLMVGEVGLDKNHPDMPAQENVLTRQIDIAARLGRTLHVHCVGAWDRMQYILAHAGCKLPRMLFHSFAGAPEIMDALGTRYDAYFSFGGDVLDPRRTRVRTVVMHADAARILVESDATTPNPVPWVLADVVAQIAALRGASETALATTIYNNTLRIMQNG